MYSLLVVENEMVLNIGLQTCLKDCGYEVDGVMNGEDAIELIKNKKFHLAILDINLSGMDGYEICEKIKSIQNIPIVFLTARDEEKDVIKGYDIGADDYITKPFNLPIFQKKIAALLKRCDIQSDNQSNYIQGELSIDFEKREVKKGSDIISLTPTEYRILEKFVKNSNIVLTKEVLLEHLWDQYNNWVDEHAIPVNISRLRAKIETPETKYIKTVFGVGYMWSNNNEY